VLSKSFLIKKSFLLNLHYQPIFRHILNKGLRSSFFSLKTLFLRGKQIGKMLALGPDRLSLAVGRANILGTAYLISVRWLNNRAFVRWHPCFPACLLREKRELSFCAGRTGSTFGS